MALAEHATRLVGRSLLFVVRHYLAAVVLVGLVVVRVRYGWDALVLVPLCALAFVVFLRFVHRRSFRWLTGWLRGRARLLVVYRPRWRHAMVETKLAIRTPKSWGERVAYNEVFPRVRIIRSRPGVDSLRVALLYGQTPEQWSEQAEPLRHIFRARRCQVRAEASGYVWLDFYFRDPLTRPVRADDLDDPGDPDTRRVHLDGLPIGRREDGRAWLLGLLGTHVLVAGATGSGKGSVIWSTVRALGPAVRTGLVELWVCDPKGGMELAFGGPMFSRFAVDPLSIADLLDDAVAVMRERAERLRGVSRLHRPTTADPLIVVVVDEIASLTAYVTDRDLKRRLAASLPLLLSQGRAPGVVVLGAIQDPRKETLPFRDLFPTRIALRMTEPDQVDLVLGDGARERGARADEIPASTPGVGYVLLDGQPDPLRVRAAWLDDDEIRAVAMRSQPRHIDHPTATDPDLDFDPYPSDGWVPDRNGEPV